MSAFSAAPSAPKLAELPVAPNTVLVLMWLPASRVMTVTVMRVRAVRALPRTLLSATVDFEDLAGGVVVDSGTLSLQLAGMQLGLTTHANLRVACEWLDMHGVAVRKGDL